jgi:hypothetical protein
MRGFKFLPVRVFWFFIVLEAASQEMDWIYYLLRIQRNEVIRPEKIVRLMIAL